MSLKKYTACLLPAVPVRKEPTDRAEMVSQLLFGETQQLLEQRDNWLRVLNLGDMYEGWVDAKQLLPLSHDEHSAVAQWRSRVATPTLRATQGGSPMLLPMGSRLPESGQRVPCNIHLSLPTNEVPTSTPLNNAMQMIGAPYLWGGKTVMGIDCSGLIQTAFAAAGLQLPRDAWQQAQTGSPVGSLNDTQPGDLAFFASPKGTIIHVGMLLSPSRILHASGSVHIDNIDSQGIINSITGIRTHFLHSIRRHQSPTPPTHETV